MMNINQMRPVLKLRAKEKGAGPKPDSLKVSYTKRLRFHGFRFVYNLGLKPPAHPVGPQPTIHHPTAPDLCRISTTTFDALRPDSLGPTQCRLSGKVVSRNSFKALVAQAAVLSLVLAVFHTVPSFLGLSARWLASSIAHPSKPTFRALWAISLYPRPAQCPIEPNQRTQGTLQRNSAIVGV